MKLELNYESKDAIPEGFDGLYTEQDGAFVLTGVNGIKTQADVENVQKALRSERQIKRELEAKLNAFEGIDTETLKDDLAELGRLRTTNGKVDDSKIEEIVAERLKLDKSAWENKLTKQTTELEKAQAQIEALVSEKNRTLIEKALRDVAAGQVSDSAMNDVLFRASLFEVSEEGNVVTKDGVGVKPGQEPKDWLEETLQTNTHWQKQSSGIGAHGNNGKTAAVKGDKKLSVQEIIESQLTFN